MCADARGWLISGILPWFLLSCSPPPLPFPLPPPLPPSHPLPPPLPFLCPTPTLIQPFPFLFSLCPPIFFPSSLTFVVITTQGYPVYLMTLHQGRQENALVTSATTDKNRKAHEPLSPVWFGRRVCVVLKAQKPAGICLFIPQRTVV